MGIAARIYAAEHRGAHVTGVTLSQQQLDFVQKRVADRGLHDQVDVRLQDYRDIDDGPYDVAASIEMGEHVGDEQYPTFVAALHAPAPPGRSLLVQQMSRGRGRRPAAARSSRRTSRPTCTCVRWARPSVCSSRWVRGARRQALREHYVRTARGVAGQLQARWNDAVVDLVGEEVARVWQLYIVGGALAFEEGRMGVDQILAVAPRPRQSSRGVSDFSWGAFVDGLAVTAVAVLAADARHVVDRPGDRALQRRSMSRGGSGSSWSRGSRTAPSAGEGNDTRRLLVAVLVSIWGLRLAGYIAIRSRGKGEDPRYADMLERANGDPARLRAPVDLPHPGDRAVVHLTAGAGVDVRAQRARRAAVGRHRGVGRRALLRGGRRRAARPRSAPTPRARAG